MATLVKIIELKKLAFCFVFCLRDPLCNVFLSIKMSAIMTLISIFSLPLILSFYVSKLALTNSNVSVNINLIIVQIFELVVLPFFLGSFFNRNNFIQTNFLRIVRIFIKGSLLFVIILGLNYFTFKDLAIYLSIIPYMLMLIFLLVVSSKTNIWDASAWTNNNQ